jgi:hypothetical protein
MRDLITALRLTADRLATTHNYQWGHMGMCNCGHVAQEVTGLTRREIHEAAQVREGDWERQAEDYCPTSGLLIDHILAAMMRLGMTRADIRNLEKLCDARVLRRLGVTHLRFNRREDVVRYMRAWADELEHSSATPVARALAAR